MNNIKPYLLNFLSILYRITREKGINLIKQKEVRLYTNYKPTTINRYMLDLLEQGYLERIGYGTYRLTDKALSTIQRQSI